MGISGSGRLVGLCNGGGKVGRIGFTGEDATKWAWIVWKESSRSCLKWDRIL